MHASRARCMGSSPIFTVSSHTSSSDVTFMTSVLLYTSLVIFTSEQPIPMALLEFSTVKIWPRTTGNIIDSTLHSDQEVAARVLMLVLSFLLWVSSGTYARRAVLFEEEAMEPTTPKKTIGQKKDSSSKKRITTTNSLKVERKDEVDHGEGRKKGSDHGSSLCIFCAASSHTHIKATTRDTTQTCHLLLV